jgi:hypothetical protein
MLPKDDDGHMPPKGDDLTKEEIALLKKWIEEGADFAGWIGSTQGMPAGAATELANPSSPASMICSTPPRKRGEAALR